MNSTPYPGEPNYAALDHSADRPGFMSPQARRRLHSTMSMSELAALAYEIVAYWMGEPDIDNLDHDLVADVLYSLTHNRRDNDTARN